MSNMLSQKSNSANILCFSKQVSSNGSRKFASALFDKFSRYYFGLLPGNRHMYEIIHGDEFIKPYFDLDCTIELNPGFDHNSAIKELIRVTGLVVEENSGIKLGSGDWLILSSSNSKKISYHLIVNHARLRIRNMSVLKNMVLIILDRLKGSDISTNVATKTGTKSFVDMSVYGRNQNFR